MLLSSTFAGLIALASALPSETDSRRPPSCRFANNWSQKDVLQHTDRFEWDMLYWEGRFHQDNVGYNVKNGMTYDGTQLNWTTGERTKVHPFSAASKEVSKLSNWANRK